MSQNRQPDPATKPSIARLIAKHLLARGWNHAGRDCWAKYQGIEPSLVLRWVAGITPEQCHRLLSELEDLRSAVQGALDSEL